MFCSAPVQPTFDYYFVLLWHGRGNVNYAFVSTQTRLLNQTWELLINKGRQQFHVVPILWRHPFHFSLSLMFQHFQPHCWFPCSTYKMQVTQWDNGVLLQSSTEWLTGSKCGPRLCFISYLQLGSTISNLDLDSYFSQHSIHHLDYKPLQRQKSFPNQFWP